MKQKIVNGILLTPFRSIRGGTIVIEDTKIIGIHEGPADVPEALEHDTARIMGVDQQKGSLAKGKDADIVFFDQNFTINLTMRQGKIIYSA